MLNEILSVILTVILLERLLGDTTGNTELVTKQDTHPNCSEYVLKRERV